MANQSGSVYGLTLFCPILSDERATPSHDLQIREYLAGLPTGVESPFAVAGGTHFARLVVLDDFAYTGMPAREEHLQSKYLVVEANIDGELDHFLTKLAARAAVHVDAIWSHCVGYPGAADAAEFVRYIKACQVPTTFYFAAVNNKSVTETLVALRTQRTMAEFVTSHQGVDAAQMQKEFLEMMAVLHAAPSPSPGATTVPRNSKTGGHHE